MRPVRCALVATLVTVLAACAAPAAPADVRAPAAAPPTTGPSASASPTTTAAPATSRAPATFRAAVRSIDTAAAARLSSSWRPGCPVPLSDLRLVTVVHWGFDGDTHEGELVVHRDVASAVVDAFAAMFRDRFPIERVRLVDEYGGDDEASMRDDNTSAFNCREVDGRPGVWSEHAYGRAIDINPLRNPWVRGDLVDPSEGRRYADRSLDEPGMLTASSPAVRAFRAVGWGWGGDWTAGPDWQHVSASGR